jgi:ADP-ribosylglycohydrolase
LIPRQIASQPNFTVNPTQAAFDDWVYHGNCKAAANGSLMRTHPLGIMCLTKSLEETFQTALEYSCLTHPDPRCVVACCISTALIRGIIRGEVVTETHIDGIITRAFNWVKAWAEQRSHAVEDAYLDAMKKKKQGKMTIHLPSSLLNRQELEKYVILPTRFPDLKLDDPDTMGYVYKALGAAILTLRRAFRHEATIAKSYNRSATESRLRIFQRLIQELVIEGGDADTNASIAGALLGAWVGYTALPPEWRDGLRHKTWLLRKGEGVCSILGVSNKGYKGRLDPDTRGYNE